MDTGALKPPPKQEPPLMVITIYGVMIMPIDKGMERLYEALRSASPGLFYDGFHISADHCKDPKELRRFGRLPENTERQWRCRICGKSPKGHEADPQANQECLAKAEQALGPTADRYQEIKPEAVG